MSLFRKPKKSIQRRVFTEDDNEDEEPLQVQISKTTQKVSKQKDTVKSFAKKQSLLSFETEEEEEEVFQVKKSTHSKRAMRQYEKERHKKKDIPEKEEVKAKEPVRDIIKDDLILKVNHKPQTPSTNLILSGRDALCVGKENLTSEEEEELTMHRFSKPNNVKIVLESGAIPDAAMIHAARKKRQRARELGDFVPVDGEEEQEDTGRLRHDDDQDDASDEERIDMTVNHSIRDQERRREQFLAAQESDQDVDEWENQQIRKGVTGASVANVAEYIEEYHANTITSPQITVAVDPNTQKTPESIVKKLRESLQTLQTSRRCHEREKQQLLDNLIRAGDTLEDLKKKAPIAAERFKYFQELRAYVTDLVECFDEKVGVINDLEQRALDLLANRNEGLIERRRQDVRDQTDEVTNISKGLRKQTEDEDKVRRAAEREGRKSRRRRTREQQSQPKHIEGMSSDDEMGQQDLINFENQREEIENEIKVVFDDVVEDFTSVTNILIRFEQWRETDINTYMDAYATLCLPRIVGPLIRLNLIFWDPLSELVELEKLDWYRTLALFGLHDDETEINLGKDPDINMLPTIIEKIIIPKLDKLVERCWDPLSTSQTLRLVGSLSRYIRRFPTLGPESKPLLSLFNTILHKLKSALETDIFIPLNFRHSEGKAFFQRQFASALKLLRNITCWQGILNENILKDLAIKGLLNRYLLAAVKVCTITDAVSKVGLINHILPRIWLQCNIPELEMFSACVMNYAHQLDKDNPLHLESIETLSNILKSLRS